MLPVKYTALFLRRHFKVFSASIVVDKCTKKIMNKNIRMLGNAIKLIISQSLFYGKLLKE
jgi:hypothetical protein